MFPYGYARDLKENWPEIWRRGGNGGNPPTSFTGNDALEIGQNIKVATEVNQF